MSIVALNPNEVLRITFSLYNSQNRTVESVHISTTKGRTMFIVSARKGFEYLEAVVKFLTDNAIEYYGYLSDTGRSSQLDFVRKDELMSVDLALTLVDFGGTSDLAVSSPTNMPFTIATAYEVYEFIVGGHVTPVRHDLFWKEQQIKFASFHQFPVSEYEPENQVYIFTTYDGENHTISGIDEIQIIPIKKYEGSGI